MDIVGYFTFYLLSRNKKSASKVAIKCRLSYSTHLLSTGKINGGVFIATGNWIYN